MSRIEFIRPKLSISSTLYAGRTDRLILGVPEEGVHDPVAERVDGQLGDPQQVLAGEGAVTELIQRREAAVQPLNLTGRNCRQTGGGEVSWGCERCLQ